MFWQSQSGNNQGFARVGLSDANARFSEDFGSLSELSHKLSLLVITVIVFRSGRLVVVISCISAEVDQVLVPLWGVQDLQLAFVALKAAAHGG